MRQKESYRHRVVELDDCGIDLALSPEGTGQADIGIRRVFLTSQHGLEGRSGAVKISR